MLRIGEGCGDRTYEGRGYRAVSDWFPALVDAGIPILVSRSSSGGRGVTEADLAGKGVKFSTPAELVELIFATDKVLCY
jgi:sulfur relay (sulfurtransferase) complex TusBCD TusD component (DsrE family)